VGSEFLSEVVAGLRIHKSEYGTFTPGGYFVGGAAENLFLWACRILDAAEQAKGDGSMGDAIRATLDSMDWTDQEFMKAYFQRLLFAAWRQLQQSERQPAD
jgi:hypothetical protein